MQNSYIPKTSAQNFCEWLNLCSVRKTSDWIVKLWVKDLWGNISEELLEKIINADTYNSKKIIRVYSSGHIFLSEDNKKVFLVTTQKDWKIQHQFTGWSPMEDENKEVIFMKNWTYKFDIIKVRNNARIRTQNRTGVKIIEEYNETPLVDWVLMENEENWEIYYKLVCLMHFIVKKYEWNLWYSQKEYVIDWNWYEIDKLPTIPNMAPNAYIVSKKAAELLEKIGKIAIISDFSKTLTSWNNPTTWSVFAKSGLLGEDYARKRNEFYNQFHDFELNKNVEKTIEWWSKHLELFIEYWLTKDLINKITKDENYFSARKWLKDFFDYIKANKIDLYIVSSGVCNFIESFLEQNWINLEWVQISWNRLFFDENWKTIKYDKDPIITSLNKNNHHFNLEYYDKIILLWDDTYDLQMYNSNCFKIWFCDENVAGYDLYLGKEWDLNEVIKKL